MFGIEDIPRGFDRFVALAAAAALAAEPPADEGQHQVLQGVVRFPELARIDVVDALPDLRIAEPGRPAGLEVAVVKLHHLVGQPGGDVDAVGDVADGDLLLGPPRPEMGPHPPRDVAVQVAHGVGPPRELQPQHGHAERLVVVLRLDAAQAHQLFEGDAQLVAQGTKVLLDQVAIETVVAGRHGRVRGEDRAMRHFAETDFEAHAVFLHPLADRLQRGKGAVAFVEVIDARRDAQGRQGADAAHARHELLPDADAVVAAVQPSGELAVLGAVAGHVAIEQVQLHPPHAHQPDFGQQTSRAGVDLHGDRLAFAVPSGLHRQVLDLGVQVFFLLIALLVEVLLEITLIVEQSAGDQRNAQGTGTLDVVAGQHAQTAGVNRNGLVYPELEGKIGHGPRAEHARVGAAPGRNLAHVFLQPPIGLVDAAVKDHFGRPHFQSLGRELGEQGDGIMVQLPPANGVEVAEEIDHLVVPTPPQISGQGDAFFIKRFRRKPV